MENFAFIVHPIHASDVARKFKVLSKAPESWVEALIKHLPPFVVSHITGIRSTLGTELEGWFIGCPLTTRQMMRLPESFVIERIIQAGRKAEDVGAKIVGLGAFTSVVGDAGITVASRLNIAVTTGNSYTVATALQGLDIATKAMDKSLMDASVVVLGATGSIGSACARILARRGVKKMRLVARNQEALEALARRIAGETGNAPTVSTDLSGSIRQADVIVSVTSAMEAIIDTDDLMSGSVVCDVSRPRNVSRTVADRRKDVLVFEGGVVAVPGDVSFGMDFGFPAKTAYACMSETMVLALEGRYESFSLGRDLSVERIEEISLLADKHGFRLAGLRSFERAMTEEQIHEIRKNVRMGVTSAAAVV